MVKVWVSEDAANMFEMVDDFGSGETIKSVFLVPRQISFVFTLESGKIRYGKVGMLLIFL